MRIVTLLPSATEIVCALGLGDRLVGVSHSCRHPSLGDVFDDIARVGDALGAAGAARSLLAGLCRLRVGPAQAVERQKESRANGAMAGPNRPISMQKRELMQPQHGAPC